MNTKIRAIRALKSPHHLFFPALPIEPAVSPLRASKLHTLSPVPKRTKRRGACTRTLQLTHGRPIFTSTSWRNETGTSPSGDGQKGLRISTVFGALVALGIGTTAYGVYEFYTSLTQWPPAVRTDLRAGLKARSQGNLVLSARYLRRALETSLTLPLSHLQTSGIAIALGAVLEDGSLPEQAYEVYAEALMHILNDSPNSVNVDTGGSESVRVDPKRSPDHAATVLESVPAPDSAPVPKQPKQLTGPEHMRATALASKLGEMAEEYRLPAKEEERWLSCAVDEMLRALGFSAGSKPVVGAHQVNGRDAAAGVEGGEDEGEGVILAELGLPNWVRKVDVCAPLERLGAFYAKEGNVQYALPLYLQVISMLAPNTCLNEDRCRGAQVMNNLAALLSRDPDQRTSAERWAQQALGVIQQVRDRAGQGLKGEETCEQTLPAVYFNLGSLREMANDRKGAIEQFKYALDASKVMGMKDGVLAAKSALRRLDRPEGVSVQSAVFTTRSSNES